MSLTLVMCVLAAAWLALNVALVGLALLARRRERRRLASGDRRRAPL